MNINDEAVAATIDAMEQVDGKMPPKKRLLVAAAILCFAQNGYAATSTRSIAEKAGVAEATIFRHYKTKHALLLGIASPLFNRLLAPAAAQEASTLLEQHRDDFRAFLRTIMLSRLAFVDKYRPFAQILIHELPVNAELRALFLDTLQNVMATTLSSAFSHFQNTGQIANLDMHKTVRNMVSLAAGYYLQRSFIPLSERDDAAELDGILDFALNGMAAR